MFESSERPTLYMKHEGTNSCRDIAVSSYIRCTLESASPGWLDIHSSIIMRHLKKKASEITIWHRANLYVFDPHVIRIGLTKPNRSLHSDIIRIVSK